jgi:hypothetical protein
MLFCRKYCIFWYLFHTGTIYMKQKINNVYTYMYFPGRKNIVMINYILYNIHGSSSIHFIMADRCLKSYLSSLPWRLQNGRSVWVLLGVPRMPVAYVLISPPSYIYVNSRFVHTFPQQGPLIRQRDVWYKFRFLNIARFFHSRMIAISYLTHWDNMALCLPEYWVDRKKY